MSHRLEKNADAKYHDYTEPKTSTHCSTTDYKNDEEHQASSGDMNLMTQSRYGRCQRTVPRAMEGLLQKSKEA